MKSEYSVLSMLKHTFTMYLEAKENKFGNVNDLHNHVAVINTLVWVLDNKIDSLYSKIVEEPELEDMTEEETLRHWENCIENIIKFGPGFYM